MEFDKSCFLFVVGVNFKVVFMKNDVIGAVMTEDIGVDIFSEGLGVCLSS
jgi:hypothetical protein